MRDIQIIGEHSVDVSLLNKGAAIDVGCLGWEFSKGMRDLGCEVHAFDLIQMDCPVAGIFFSVVAITDKDEVVNVMNTSDRQAWHLNPKGQIQVNSISLNKLYKFFEHTHTEVDILKLDCEGSELDILSDLSFRPVPKQISVEWHMHCQKTKHERLYRACIANLEKYYTLVSGIEEPRHGCVSNRWDDLYIRKDLL